MDTFWGTRWERIRQRTIAWWERRGLVLWITAPRDILHPSSVSLHPFTDPPAPISLATRWLDPVYRARRAEYDLLRTYHGGEAFPIMDTNIGPGNLATFLGSDLGLADDTVWYWPCIADPDACPPLAFDPEHPRFLEQMAIIEEAVRLSAGRFLVGMPDLIENVDILASLRGAEDLMRDLVDRPEFVKRRVAEINAVYFAAFDRIYERIETPWGGNAFCAFCIWGPGKTAKLQCDASAMFSRRVFDAFVRPALAEQCRWLDYSLYHLDGTQAMHHLDSLLEIAELDAIEWTPQAGKPGGGDPLWFDLYRRILRAGKSVQAVGVAPAEVIPLLDAVGPAGMYLMVEAESETAARELEERVEGYRG